MQFAYDGDCFFIAGTIWLVSSAGYISSGFVFSSTILALGVTVSFTMIMYVSLFYTISFGGVYVMVIAATSFLTGAVVPFPFFPVTIRAVLEALPFAAMQNMPLRIYSGNIAGVDALQKSHHKGDIPMGYFRKIVGKNLYLSPISVNEEDTKSYISWMNNRAVAEHFGQYNRIVSSKNDLKWLFEPPADMQRYAMILPEGDVLIGSISIHNIDHHNRNAFIGIFIGKEEHRGRGYGGEAIALLLEYGFKTLNLRTILLTVHGDNYGGIACYKKVGFREVGRLPEHIFKDGQYVDKLYMCIKARDFHGYTV